MLIILTYVLGKKAMKNPAMMNAMSRAQSIPPQAVKSYLVWKAKMVSPRVTPTVMTMAIQIDSV